MVLVVFVLYMQRPYVPNAGSSSEDACLAPGKMCDFPQKEIQINRLADRNEETLIDRFRPTI